MFLIFFPPASVWLGRDMIDDNKNGDIAVTMVPPLVLQILGSRPDLSWKVLQAYDSEADRHPGKFERRFRVVVETWYVIERKGDGLGAIGELDVIGSHLLGAAWCVVGDLGHVLACDQVGDGAGATAHWA